MSLRLPFFGLIAQRSPLQDLVKHYEQIDKGMKMIEDALTCYIEDSGPCVAFVELTKQVDDLEERADKIKRSIRNHIPRSLFMPVDKTIFINYTRSQDNILDDGQDALNWLLMRKVNIPEVYRKDLMVLVDEVSKTVELLRFALESTIDLVNGKSYDRSGTKDKYRAVRSQHKIVRKHQAKLISAIYNSDMDFKDIHQLIHFVKRMNGMSHNTEGCADILRSMIAR